MSNEVNSSIAFSADELLNLAIMTKTSIIIVEGIDDVPIYERISLSVNIECDIYASETLYGKREGCNGVIENISEIRLVSSGISIEKYVLGIIDRDVRFYRNEIPGDPAIFTLNYYSIESHYISLCSTKYLIPRFTNATHKLIKESQIKRIHDHSIQHLEFLYYVSLEALKNACIRDYESEYGYSRPIKAIINQGLHEKIQAKRIELDHFASELGLSNSIDSILKICKGKWIHEVYSDILYGQIKKLPEDCFNSIIPRCQSCANGEPNKCLYRSPSFFNADMLRTHAFQNTDMKSLHYIKERLLAFADQRPH
jgi:hypothetical protein